MALLRKAMPTDVDAVVHVGRVTWPATYGPIAGEDYVRMGLDRWWTPSASLPGIEAGRCTVAEEPDGSIVGVATVGPLDGDLVLFRLYVLPGHQGKGIGAKLLEDVCAEARRGGHQQLRLSYVDGNEHAQQFYAARGFRETHREATGPGLPDSVWMVCDLWGEEDGG